MSKTELNPLLIYDEDAKDMSAQITGALTPTLGVQTATAFGAIFGKARHATANDLFVLPSSSAIATVVNGAPAPINVNGISYPLQDKWVLTPQEQATIKTATDAYNVTIESVVSANANLALVDFKGVLEEASSTGIMFDEYNLTTNLVVGGLISLDGVHLTARGYALMANKILEAMDNKFGSNFTKATNGLAKARNYPTNYSPSLR
jgi:lysophospholipase L1-like esterase